jgi:hypothetical protein
MCHELAAAALALLMAVRMAELMEVRELTLVEVEYCVVVRLRQWCLLLAAQLAALPSSALFSSARLLTHQHHLQSLYFQICQVVFVFSPSLQPSRWD